MNSLKKYPLKVIVIGESGAGKTSLVRQYVEQRFSIREKNTIGVNLSTKRVRFDDREVTLQIWDTAGQERFSCLSSYFYRGVDCCVLVFDITDFASFIALDRWRDEFLIQANLSDPANFPFMVLGNKVDLGNSHVSHSFVNEWCQRNNNMTYFETSAKEGTNLDLAFKTLSLKALNLEPEVVP
nr:ras-related protein rab7-like [Drosophila bipectinata]